MNSKSTKHDNSFIMLSVCIITYNHKDFLSEAIESAVAQRVNFNFEVVISDDCSTDGTFDIAQRYRDSYPNLIRCFRHEKNLGISANWVSRIEACRGKYIALLEGDDFWTCTDKLQRQVDFLESHSQYIFSYHGFNMVSEDGINERCDRNKLNEQIRELTFHDILYFLYPQTLTVVFRNGDYRFNEFFQGLSVCDNAFYHLLLTRGKAYYLNFIGGTYRLHRKQVSNFYDEYKTVYEKTVFLKRLFPFVDSESRCELSKYLSKYFLLLYSKHQPYVFSPYLRLCLKYYFKVFSFAVRGIYPKKIKNEVSLFSVILLFLQKISQRVFQNGQD